MPAKRITDAWVRDLTWAKAVNQHCTGKTGKKQITFMDTIDRGLALVLVLSSGGTKAWRVITYTNGKAQSKKIGIYPKLTVKAAREMARDIYKNPNKFRAAAAAGSFKDVAEEYMQREGKRLRSAAWRRGVLKRLVYKSLGNRPIADIKRSEIVRLLDKIEAGEMTDDNRGPIQGGPVMADQTLAVIRKIMNWWATRSDDFRSPIVRGMARTKPRERARERTLTDDELRAVWKSAGSGQAAFGCLVQFLLLTGARRTEAARMASAELSVQDWALPAARNKTKVDLVRPLSDEAKRVLSRVPRFDDCDFVFSTDGRSPISGFSKFKKQFDQECGVTGWTLHDLRRTARSLMSRAGVHSDVAELCLGHVLPGVRGTYDRHAYYSEKQQCYEALAAQIDRIVNPRENVISMGERRT